MTAYLTCIWLDEREAAHARLFDTYDWHQSAWKCFPSLHDRESKRGRYIKGTKPDQQRRIDTENPPAFLTRLDRKDGGFRLLIVSPVAPTRPEWTAPGDWQSREIPPEYFGKRRYRFQLRANPTKKLRVDKPDGARKKNGRRIPLTTPEELIPWMQRKGDAGGFHVHGLDPDADEPCAISPAHRFYFYRENDGQRGLHAGVDFTGILEVTDPARFHETFRAGLGSAKAFGFGLLIIAPA